MIAGRPVDFSGLNGGGQLKQDPEALMHKRKLDGSDVVSVK